MAYKRRPGAKAPDMALVSEARKEELQIEAEAKVIAERTVAAERAKFDPTLEMVELTIDLPANASRLLIDYRPFHHGQIVSVTKAQDGSIQDQMARMWEQEKQAGNPNLRDYKPIKNYDLSAKTGESPGAPALLRV